MAISDEDDDQSVHIARARLAMDEKRDTERVEILGELRGEIMVFQPLAITEVGRLGAQVETSFPLHVDSLHDVRLTLGDRSVVLKARVAHCSISDMDQELVLYRSGLEFVEPSDRVFLVIADFIDVIRNARNGESAGKGVDDRVAGGIT